MRIIFLHLNLPLNRLPIDSHCPPSTAGGREGEHYLRDVCAFRAHVKSWEKSPARRILCVSFTGAIARPFYRYSYCYDAISLVIQPLPDAVQRCERSENEGEGRGEFEGHIPGYRQEIFAKLSPPLLSHASLLFLECQASTRKQEQRIQAPALSSYVRSQARDPMSDTRWRDRILAVGDNILNHIPRHHVPTLLSSDVHWPS